MTLHIAAWIYLGLSIERAGGMLKRIQCFRELEQGSGLRFQLPDYLFGWQGEAALSRGRSVGFRQAAQRRCSKAIRAISTGVLKYPMLNQLKSQQKIDFELDS